MERVEDILLPYVEFLCSSAIKEYNNNCEKSHIVLVGGGKAFNEYVEKENRKDSFDYDCKIYIKNSIIDMTKQDSICMGVLYTITNKINEFLDNYRTSYIIYTALKKCGIDAPEPRNGGVKANFDTRVSVISNMKVYYIYLKYRGFTDGEEIILPTIMEFVKVIEEESKINSYYNSVKTCINLPNTLIDESRFYIPFDDLLLDVKLLSKNNNYPKKDKMIERLQVLEDAISNNKLVCEIRQDKNSCLDKVVFDFTDQLQNFQKYEYPRIDLHEQFLNDNKNLLKSVTIYTGSSYSTINGILWRSYVYNNTFTETCDELNINKTGIDIINDISEAMDMDKPYDNIVAYRHTGFIDFNYKNSESSPVNMYNIKKGTIINNVSYLSCTLTNQNSAIHKFNYNTQFKGCLFKINISTKKGYIVIGNKSNYSDEKEIILDYRGALKVTNVSFKYTTEFCKSNIKYMERLFIEADYLFNDGTIVQQEQPTIVFVDNKIINDSNQDIIKELEKIKLYKMTDLKNDEVPREKVETKFGSFNVPTLIRKNEEVLGLTKGTLLKVLKNIPGNNKNKYIILFVCLFILVLIIFIYKYSTTNKTTSQTSFTQIIK